MVSWVVGKSCRASHARDRAAAVLALAIVCGCHHPAQLGGPKPTTEPVITQRPLPMRAEPMLIKQGPPPLALIVEAPQTLRFADLTSGNDLAKISVDRGQVVSIDAHNGVMVGETVVRPGPLAADHTFGIWLEPDTNNGMTNTTIIPRVESKSEKK